MKSFVKLFLIFSALALLIPCCVFLQQKNGESFDETPENIYEKITTVQLFDEESLCQTEMSFDDYLTLCVLAQMPYTFEPEALKVQAIICRTCVYYAVENAEKTVDFGTLQKYFTEEKAKEYYGEKFDQAYSKTHSAVLQTDGVIITYGGVPIVTAFHPISCGFTENAQDIFGEKIPYLTSVESSQDKTVEGFEQILEFSETEFFSRLCAFCQIEQGENISVNISKQTSLGTVLAVEVCCDGTKKEITGTEFCDVFGLNSCNLDIEISDNICKLTCRGGGHLVGLSQYGANIFAQQGKSFEEIIKHYFSGVSLTVLQ